MQCNLLLIVWSGRISQETLLLAKELEKNSAFQLGPKTEKNNCKVMGIRSALQLFPVD
jgi:hypothetical protein